MSRGFKAPIGALRALLGLFKALLRGVLLMVFQGSIQHLRLYSGSFKALLGLF